MTTIGGGNKRRLQAQAVRRNGWTKARRTTFLKVLAETSNATMAARAAGKSVWSARELRQRDGEFSLLWEEALQAGYERLEDELLARALGQASSGDNPSREEIADAPVAVPAFDAALAIKVLQLRDTRGTGIGRGAGRRPGRVVRSPMTQGEVDAALLARLDALAKRKGGEGA